MNKRKSSKSFPLAATVIVVAVAVCTVTFLVKALMVKYQVVEGGNKLKRLEREFSELTVKNEALQTRKDTLTSPTRLKAVIDKGFIDLRVIDEKYVVNVGRPVKVDVAANISAVREEER